jgi:molecular chaperone DnaJ
MKNYYLILGVAPDATLEQIRGAFRRQAKELHPDYYGQDSRPFIDLQEAYAVLSDPARRRAYDKKHSRPAGPRGGYGRVRSKPLDARAIRPEPLIPDQEPVDLGDHSLTGSFQSFSPSFEALFGRLRQNFSISRPEADRLRSLNVVIRISPYDALRGGRVRLLVPARLRCPACGGQGGIGYYACRQCAGAGVIVGEYPVTLTYPPGIVDNYVAEIPLDQFGISNFYLKVIFRFGESG